jgi:hypothetical protein
MEQKILCAKDRLVALENELFVEIRQVLLASTERLQLNGALLAELDAYVSLAEVASNNGYCRPKLNQQGRVQIVNGRHPVIERALKEPFVPNDVLLDRTENRLLIITGPNMAARAPICGRSRDSLMAHVVRSCPRSRRILQLSIAFSPASARATTFPPARARSWWR